MNRVYGQIAVPVLFLLDFTNNSLQGLSWDNQMATAFMSGLTLPFPRGVFSPYLSGIPSPQTLFPYGQVLLGCSLVLHGDIFPKGLLYQRAHTGRSESQAGQMRLRLWPCLLPFPLSPSILCDSVRRENRGSKDDNGNTCFMVGERAPCGVDGSLRILFCLFIFYIGV